jgi:hypothetical protein
MRRSSEGRRPRRCLGSARSAAPTEDARCQPDEPQGLEGQLGAEVTECAPHHDAARRLSGRSEELHDDQALDDVACAGRFVVTRPSITG